MYQRKVDVDMLNAVKDVLADVSSLCPSSEQRGDYGLGESWVLERVGFRREFNQQSSNRRKIYHIFKMSPARRKHQQNNK